MKRQPLKIMRQKTGIASYAQGLWAEKLAELWLRVKGYRILGKRLATPSGEIDLLAAKGKILVVVEVKKRGSAESAGSAISARQLQRLIAASGHVLARHPGYETLRFDAMLFAPKSLPRHIKNAFQAD